MSIKTILRWYDLIRMLEGKSNKTYTESKNTFTKIEKMKYSMELLKKVENMFKPKIEKTERGVYFYPTVDPNELFQNMKQIESKSLFNLVFIGSNPFAYAGQSLAKITQVNTGDILAVGVPGYGTEGSPQQGAVFLMKNGKISILYGEKLFSKFGWQVVTAHFDNDPYEDLIGKN